MKHQLSVARGPYAYYNLYYGRGQDPYKVYFAEDDQVIMVNDVQFGISNKQYIALTEAVNDLKLSDDSAYLNFTKVNGDKGSINLTSIFEKNVGQLSQYLQSLIDGRVDEEAAERERQDAILKENIDRIEELLPDDVMLVDNYIRLSKNRIPLETSAGINVEQYLKDTYIDKIEFFETEELDSNGITIPGPPLPYLKFTYNDEQIKVVRISLASLLPKAGIGITIKNNTINISESILDIIGVTQNPETGELQVQIKEDMHYISGPKNIVSNIYTLDQALFDLEQQISKYSIPYATEIAMSKSDPITVYENFQITDLTSYQNE